MQVKFSLAKSPQWVGIYLVALTALTIMILAIVGAAGYWQGQKQASSQRAEILAELRDQLERRLQAGDLSGAIQLGEHLESLGVLDDAEKHNVQMLRELKATKIQEAVEPLQSPVPIQHDHELWQAALAAHGRSEWSAAIEFLRDLQEVDRKFVTVAYVELLEDAYIRWARSLVTGYEGERAIALLRIALALRQDEGVQLELEAANLIIDSLSTWGVDWPSTLEDLHEVYQFDPNYVGLPDLLSQAIDRYGEGAEFRGSTCEAYLFLSGEQMISLLRDLQKEAVRSRMKAACEAATD